MKKLAIVVAAFAALLVSAAPASAQTGVGVYVGPGGFSVSVNHGHGHGRHYGHGNGRYRHGHVHGPNCGHHHGPVYTPPIVVPRYPDHGCNRGCDNGYYQTPRPITVQVWDTVRGPYGYVRVQRWVTAYWSNHFNAYVWSDSYGRQHVLHGGGY